MNWKIQLEIEKIDDGFILTAFSSSKEAVNMGELEGQQFRIHEETAGAALQEITTRLSNLAQALNNLDTTTT